MISDKDLKEEDFLVFDAIKKERIRQDDHIELIASENYVSKAVLEAQGSIMTNKYAEGYPGHRYYGGCEYVDIVENLARDRIKNYLIANMLMFNPILVPRLIWRYFVLY